MNPPAHDAAPRFHVTVTRTTPTTARAQAHGQHLDFAIKGGDPNVGFTPPEVLLASLGGCILSNVTRMSAQMGIAVDAAEVVFDAAKRIDPLGIDPLRYRLTLTSAAPMASLEELHRRATTDGAVTSALINGVSPEGDLVVRPIDAEQK